MGLLRCRNSRFVYLGQRYTWTTFHYIIQFNVISHRWNIAFPALNCIPPFYLVHRKSYLNLVALEWLRYKWLLSMYLDISLVIILGADEEPVKLVGCFVGGSEPCFRQVNLSMFVTFMRAYRGCCLWKKIQITLLPDEFTIKRPKPIYFSTNEIENESIYLLFWDKPKVFTSHIFIYGWNGII